MPVSTIRLVFEGMLLMFINDNREYCDVRFLKDVPHHEPKLLITKIPRDGAPEKLLELLRPDFNDNLWLDVNKTAVRVRIHRSCAADPFVRTETSDNVGDFRWAVNLEGHEVYNKELKPGIAFDKLGPRLRINDGMFYAQTPSSSNALTRKRPSEPETQLGKVAVQLRAEIGLDAEQSASFFNGVEELPLPAATDIDYGIYVCNGRPHGHEAALTEIDANNYHLIVAGDLAPNRRIQFGRYPSARSTPDATCLIGWMGSTELP